ncbi:FHA domain-containing protein [Pseudofrankia saprophytica]|uniref:FHA domain-containing protein n=1 Tax=Pseudofrankia saprophytica TaxID=298655 RepID=UPI0004827225|nr:FHA domain-containing protein [Pseudofrankia saprophytica]
MATTLSIRSGPNVVVVPPGRPFVVGRSAASDLVLSDGRVSRRHLLIEPAHDGWAVVDLSSNGTWHDGRRVRRVELTGQVRLRLGTADGPEVTLLPAPVPDPEPPRARTGTPAAYLTVEPPDLPLPQVPEAPPAPRPAPATQPRSGPRSAPRTAPRTGSRAQPPPRVGVGGLTAGPGGATVPTPPTERVPITSIPPAMAARRPASPASVVAGPGRDAGRGADQGADAGRDLADAEDSLGGDVIEAQIEADAKAAAEADFDEPDDPDDPAADGHHELRTMQRDDLDRLPGPLLPPVGRGGPATVRPGEGRVHRLTRGMTSIGRALDNDIVVGDLLASRQHAEVFVGRSGVEVVDLGSANGTFVNGQRVERRLLATGDVVAIGHHILRAGDGELVEYLDTGDVTFQVDGLCVDAGDTRLLHDVSFRLPGHSLLAVIGPSGAGKSTLLGALTGFRPADLGAVRYGGRDLYAEYDELRRRIGYVPQDDILHTSLTVRQALEYGAQLRFPAETTKQERGARVDAVLAELGLTGGLADRQVSTLSGGQRKRTSVALELLTQPTLLYLDEPTSGLDPGLDKEVMESLRRLADGGRTVVVVTHSVAQLELCDYVLVLAKGGHVAYFGPPQHALPFLGEADWADAFRALQTTEGAADVARRYRASNHFIQGTAVVPAARPRPVALPSIRQQSVFCQLGTLSRRYLRVIVSDRSYLRLVIAYPFVLGLIPRVMDAPFGLTARPDGQPNRQVAPVLLVLVLCICFMGAANAVREIVKEREIYRRERGIGLSITAYLGSKICVLTLVTALQSAVVTAIGLAGRTPAAGVVSGYPLLELLVVVTATALASTMLGLLISALVDEADKTMPLLVLVSMAQIIFTGVLMRVTGRIGLEQVSYVFPARWGFAGLASATGLVDVERLNDPRLNPESVVDPLWLHTPTTFLVALGGTVALGVAYTAVTALLLRRLDPRILRRAAPRAARRR